MRLRQMEGRNKQAADAVLKVHLLSLKPSKLISVIKLISTQNRLSPVIDMEEQQHQILSNFDTFLKIAGSELGALRSVAR